MIRLSKVISYALIVMSAFCQFAIAQNIENLSSDIEAIKDQITQAETKKSLLSGGLIMNLIEARIEILLISKALMEQRVLTIKTGDPITVQAPGTLPNDARAALLEKEIISNENKLALAIIEANKYSGGLIGGMKLATVATMEQSIAMLQQDYLMNKYGLAIPSLNSTNAGNSDPISVPTDNTDTLEDVALQILIPTVTNKRLAEQDYQDYIWFDVHWAAANLKKPTRSIKGSLLFNNLFGENQFGVSMTIDEQKWTLLFGQISLILRCQSSGVYHAARCLLNSEKYTSSGVILSSD